jgi:hypothetical protein
MIDRFIFSQTNVDSGSLTVLASVVHRFSEPGEYFGKIKRGENEVGQFKIIVEHSPTMQSNVKIDLKTLEAPPSEQSKNTECSCFNLVQGGYALFFVSTGAGGYNIEITKPENEGKKAFDNRELMNQDMFVASLLRPGTYRITNTLTKAEAELKIVYPQIGKTQRQSQSIQVECNEKSINPSKITVNPGQGVVFSFKVPSRIKIELVTPEDKPKQTYPENQTTQAKTMQEAQMPEKKIIRRLRLNPL